MSKLNQIQNELRQLSGGAFQKLADAYLHKKGYEQINPLGSVIGADQVRKGTPDTLVPLPNGKYVFAEHTTESDKKKGKVFQKFKGDLHKCFDEAKTGIPVSKIQEIVLCHTSMLAPDEEKALREECQRRGVNLNIFGIGPISYDLYQKYPGVARDFLEVEVDTGQIVDVAEFVDAYNKRAATSLGATFYFREKEVEQILQDLESNGLVIVSGKTGVGKSRFVLECCARFLITHSEYQVRCIFFRGQDLFEDLRVYFSEPGSYLIFVDDANRVNSFNYFIQLLHDQRQDQQIKVIVTVRDYALNKVQGSVEFYKNWSHLELMPLDDQQIKQLLRDEYEILNHLYLDRIANIAQGNPRLAIMAALLAKQENRLESINDVSNLYDEYYCSIRKDLKDFSDEDLLKTAGIVAFFRTIERSNEAIMTAIETAFGVSQEVFWKAARQLHDHELLDLYESEEVVKVSDQVLATYLFYLAFFKERLLNFNTLLNYFFPQCQNRLIDALNPVLSTFDSERCIEVMRPHIDRLWKEYKDAEDETNLMHLIQIFWFLKETDILIHVRDCISKMESESVDLSKLEIKSNSHIPSSSPLKILGLFSHSSESNLKIALALVLNYTAKRPTEISQVVYLLTERFGFDYDSYRYGFAVQQIVIDVLWSQIKNVDGIDVMFAKLFIAVAEHYLYTDFDTTRMKGRVTINIFQFTLPSTPELIELRRTIWRYVFQLYTISLVDEDVLNLLYKYSTSDYKVSVKELLIQDSVEVLPFIQLNVGAESYSNCLIVQSYLDLLERHNVPFSDNLREHFTNKTYALASILVSDRLERRYLNLGYEEYEQVRQQRIQDFFEDYNFEDYKKFFECCLEIQKETDRRNHNAFYLPGQVARVLIDLANRDSQLYIDVIKYYLASGNLLKIDDPHIIGKLIQVSNIDDTYEILNQTDYALKRKWLFNFYRLLPEETLRKEHLDQLRRLYRESQADEIPHDINFILKYRVFDENIIINVVEIILENAAISSSKLFPLSYLFNRYTESNANLFSLFENHLHLFKQVYLKSLETDLHADDDGKGLAYILNRDPKFIFEYIDWIYQQKECSSRFEYMRDYSFLWKYENYVELISQIVEYVYARNREKLGSQAIRADKFFILSADEENSDVLWKRQDQLLTSLVENRCDDIEFVQFVFDIIINFAYERRYPFIALFLKQNKTFEDFEKLSLETNFWSYSGSRVPTYQKRIEYLESLLPLLDTVDLLEHKQHIEGYIQWLRDDIENEKKQDFMND